jgi:hypothetical protein
MKFDENNIIIEDLLAKEEIEEIRSLVARSYNSYLMKPFTQRVSNFDLPYRIAKKIIAYAEDISGVDGLQIESYQFAKYENAQDTDGTILRPNLFPHCDQTFIEPRFTIDYQIGSNTDWPIVVEGEEFTLKNNQALTFSGTHQVHWRTPKIFNDGEFIEMIFFHLKKRVSEPYPSSVNEIINEKMQKFNKMYRDSHDKQ